MARPGGVKRLRVIPVIGTRPEAIKLAPIVRELTSRGEDVAVDVCVTGQHRELAEDVLRRFAIEPRYRLATPSDQLPLGIRTAEMMAAIARLLQLMLRSPSDPPNAAAPDQREAFESSIGRWRTDMSPDDVRLVEAICGDRLDELGYFDR